MLHNAVVSCNTLHIGSVVQQLRAEGHTIDDTTLSLITPRYLRKDINSLGKYPFDLEYRQTADPSPGETPQALNGGFRSDVASTVIEQPGRRLGSRGVAAQDISGIFVCKGAMALV